MEVPIPHRVDLSPIRTLCATGAGDDVKGIVEKVRHIGQALAAGAGQKIAMGDFRTHAAPLSSFQRITAPASVAAQDPIAPQPELPQATRHADG